MLIIDRVEIQYFRSIYRQFIYSVKPLSILTGKNDAGKSNVLKALNLFFNNETDNSTAFFFADDFNFRRLNEVRQDSIKGKQFIQIKITFLRGNQFQKTLPETFTVTKKWLRSDSMPSIVTDDVEKRMLSEGKEYNDRCKSSLTAFLNKIKYVYVPAIKDNDTFSKMLNELQDCIYNDKLSTDKNLMDALTIISNGVSSSADEINEEFNSVTGISTSITTPQTISGLYKTLGISTKYGENNININKRGDGIRVRYIPSILNYIANSSRKNYIWGFEEPENSLEYGLALEMAQSFKNTYTNTSMIFLTSHSPAFISLDVDNTVQIYRCFNVSEGTIIRSIREIEKGDQKYPELSEELGYMKLQKELYLQHSKALAAQKELEANNKALATQLSRLRKPVILTEGKTDALILKTAWEKLYSTECPYDIKSCNVNNETDTSSAGCAMLRSYLESYRFDSQNIVIGLFDRDTAGIKEYSLNKNFRESDNTKWKYSRNGKAYAMLLPIPIGKEQFATSENLSIEFMFDKADLEKKVNGFGLELLPQEIIERCAGKVIGRRDAIEFHLFRINDNTKVYFAEKIVPTLQQSSFVHFKLIFDIIEEIMHPLRTNAMLLNADRLRLIKSLREILERTIEKKTTLQQME